MPVLGTGDFEFESRHPDNNMENEQLFYVVQKAFIKREDEVLTLNDPEEGLDYPGGKIQNGEKDPVGALTREVLEETGLEISIGKPFYTAVDEYPENHKYAGKKFFIVFYECHYVSGEVGLSAEHNNFRWVSKTDFESVNDSTWYFDVLSNYFNK